MIVASCAAPLAEWRTSLARRLRLSEATAHLTARTCFAPSRSPIRRYAGATPPGALGRRAHRSLVDKVRAGRRSAAGASEPSSERSALIERAWLLQRMRRSSTRRGSCSAAYAMAKEQNSRPAMLAASKIPRSKSSSCSRSRSMSATTLSGTLLVTASLSRQTATPRLTRAGRGGSRWPFL